MRVRVAYGRLTGDALKRASCVRCGGEGWCKPFFQADRLVSCPRCEGSGICISDGFTYSSPFPVERGDIVLVGVKRWGEPYGEEEATVLGLGSTYDGDARQIVRVIERAKAASA